MSKKSLADATSVPCPFVILADKNEHLENHNGWTFQGISSNADTNYLPFDVEVKPQHLQSLGDYGAEFPTLGPFDQPKIRIERKSKADLFQSITNRENMEWRLNRLANECEFAVVVVEAEFSEMRNNPPPFTQQTFKVVHNTIQSWQQRFRNVHWAFYPGADLAEIGAFWYMYRFYENLKNNKLDQDRKRINHKAYLEGIRDYRKKVKINECPHPKHHAIGDLADYWCRGWLEMERIAQNKSLDIHEPPLPLPNVKAII